ncbi:MAG: prepilin-type N-terminal cleavage/methylation domain-containing protein [Rickettsiales bacterium]
MTYNTNPYKAHQDGFTLVELSIVLVIIGLIVGGILVGQDMIKAATVRSQMTQIDSFNSAANTFRDKYRYYPGDVASTVATQYGLIAAAARTGANSLGDGDGLIEGSATAANVADLANEVLLFWSDLNQVGMIAGGFYDSTRTTTNVGGTAITQAGMNTFLPTGKLGRGTNVIVFPAVGNNYFYLGTPTGATATAGVVGWQDGLTPTEADNLDEKMDDGFPDTGIIRSFNTSADAIAAAQTPTGGAAAPAAGDCYNTTGKDDYATSVSSAANEAIANQPGCNLRIRSTF